MPEHTDKAQGAALRLALSVAGESHPESTSASDGGEAAFRRYFVARMLPICRAAVALAIALIIILCVLDSLLMPQEFYSRAIPFRTVTMLVPLSVVFAVSIIWPRWPWLPHLVATVSLVAGLSTFAISGIASNTGAVFVHWSAVFATFYVYLVLGLTMRQSAAVGWPLFLAFVALGVLQQVPAETLAYGIVFLGFSNVIGTYACYLIERNAREIFTSQKSLEVLARTDALTGLCNRRTFDIHLDTIWRQAQREERRIAILLIDIDHFKLYNDCYGHQAGDRCIEAVANSLASRVNRPLDLVCRYGGEEFAIVLYDASAAFLQTVADRICEDVTNLALEHKASPVQSVVTVSVGVASSRPIRERDPDALVRRADDALYDAKSKGRNQAVFFNKGWGGETTSFIAADLATNAGEKKAASSA